MTTILDVAKLAGVAPITVSRVINNSGYISGDVRQRVQAAVEELGYVPNTLARSLRSRQTHMLALVLTDITNPFWTTVARGVEDAASDAGFMVILCNTDESEVEQETYLQALVQRRVDGMLLVPACNNPAPVHFLQRQDIPLVFLDRHLPGMEVDCVRSDSEHGAYQLTQLLLKLGHRRIVHLGGPKDVSTSQDRAAGYRRAMTEAGLKITTQRVIHGEFSLKSGYSLALEVLACEPRPSALFAGNNFIAIGALKALRDQGLRVPEDMAVVGFDDLPAALIVDPFLTVAAQPAYQMGYQATQLLLGRITGQSKGESQEVILPVEIIVRQSSGSPRSETEA